MYLIFKVINILFSANTVERESIQVDPKIYENFAGLYEFPNGIQITVTTKDKRLFAQAKGQPSGELFPQSELKYFLKLVNAQVEFIRNESGKITEMIVFQAGLEIKGEKIE